MSYSYKNTDNYKTAVKLMVVVITLTVITSKIDFEGIHGVFTENLVVKPPTRAQSV